MKASVIYSVRGVTLLLLGVIGLLVVLAAIGDAAHYFLADPPAWVVTFHREFDLTNERNIPTWYASALLLLCGLLLGNLGLLYRRSGERYAGHWLMLGMIFVLLSIDETASLHERLIAMTRDWVPKAGGLLRYSWVVPYLAGVLVLGLAYVKFLWHLPVRTRRLIILAGAMYVGGAAGMEMLEGLWVTQMNTKGQANLGSFLLTTTEETLEMTALVVFFHALSVYTSVWLRENRRSRQHSYGQVGMADT